MGKYKFTRNAVTALTACCSLLLLAGCGSFFNNAVNSDSINYEEELAVNVASGNHNVTPMKISSVYLDGSASRFDDSSSSDTKIHIKSNYKFDKASVAGITVKPLIDDKTAETADEVYSTGTAIPFTYEIDNSNYEIILSVPLKDVKGVEVYLNSKNVCSRKGNHLDQDEDYTQAEAGEDDYVKYFYSNSKTSSDFQYGVERYTYKKFSLSYNGSSTSNSTGTLNSISLYSYDSTGDLINEDFSEAIKKDFKLQVYTSASKKWTDINYVIDRSISGYSSYYKFTFEPVEIMSYVRIKTVNPKSIKSSKTYHGVYAYFEPGYTGYGTNVIYQTFVSGSTAYSPYYQTYACNQDFFSDITCERNKAGYIAALSFTVNTDNNSINSVKNSEYSGMVCGVSDIMNNIVIYDGAYNVINPGRYEAYESDSTVCNVNGDKTFKKTVKYIFDKPIAAGEVLIYAKPDLTITYNKTDYYKSSDLDGQVSYKMGLSLTESERLNPKTGGLHQLADLCDYIVKLDFASDNNNEYVKVASFDLPYYKTIKWEFIEAPSTYMYVDVNGSLYGYSGTSSSYTNYNSNTQTYVLYVQRYAGSYKIRIYK